MFHVLPKYFERKLVAILVAKNNSTRNLFSLAVYIKLKTVGSY